MKIRIVSFYLSLVVITAALVGNLAVVGSAQAQSSQPTPPAVSDDQVNVVAKELYCPVCENIPLDVCPTQACAQWRELIRQKLGEGWGKQQIKDFFARQYGDRVLAEPPQQGLNWLVYILPIVVFLGGVFLLVRVFRPGRRQAGSTGESAPVSRPAGMAESDYLRRLEDELKQRK